MPWNAPERRNDFPYFVQEGFPRDFLLTENTLVERSADGGVPGGDGKHLPGMHLRLVHFRQTDPSNPLFTRGEAAGPTIPSRFSTFRPTRSATASAQSMHSSGLCLRGTRAHPPKDQIVGLLQLNSRRKGFFSARAIRTARKHRGASRRGMQRKQAEEGASGERGCVPRPVSKLHVAISQAFA